ncbi:ArsR/SmtB family transcription factor [Natronobiforma cellulositropha]|uniref:ArsR/SmtB family transcription factor n=1 Tax=Natronobiforma cellulositropha TaxID=1679076 RepID=UPI0021D5F049|nr:metalloregulator ArsR/SmtB family transcription factor [Natronobiforma cellulositropha]
MSQSDDRLRRYLEDELGACRDDDVTARMQQLVTLDEGHTASARAVDLEALSALANETRYTIVRLLIAADEDLCVCELVPLLEVSQSAVSHALSQLHDAGLVTRHKDGKWRKYAPTPRAIALVAALDGTRP